MAWVCYFYIFYHMVKKQITILSSLTIVCIALFIPVVLQEQYWCTTQGNQMPSLQPFPSQTGIRDLLLVIILLESALSAKISFFYKILIFFIFYLSINASLSFSESLSLVCFFAMKIDIITISLIFDIWISYFMVYGVSPPSQRQGSLILASLLLTSQVFGTGPRYWFLLLAFLLLTS